MKAYVLGFLFDGALKRVLLIEKNPTRADQQWQRGLLNGIGGGIEETDENPEEAMRRECKEETGLTEPHWQYFARMDDDESWECYCFFARNDCIDDAVTVEREQLHICDVQEIYGGKHRTIENIPWLVALALDFADDGRPGFSTITYPPTP